jgi:hypothetical protein
MAAVGNYNFTSSDGTTAQFGLGDEVDVNGSRWKYLKSAAAIAQYAACTVQIDYEAEEATTTTSGAIPTLFAIPQFAVAGAAEYFWAPIGPFGPYREDGQTRFKVKAAASCADSVKLYTTATDGVVDDSATDLISGLLLIETIVGAEAADCIAVCRMNSNCQD